MNSSLKLCCFKKQQIGAVQRVLASVRVRTRDRACTLFYVYFYFSTCVEDTCCRDVENTSRDVEIVEMYRGARQLLLLSPIAPRQCRHAALAADTFDLFNFAFQVVCNEMPFPTRPLQPVCLGRVPPPPGEDPLLWVSNHNLCQAMRQLVSLLKQADSLFADLEVRVEGGIVC